MYKNREAVPKFIKYNIRRERCIYQNMRKSFHYELNISAALVIHAVKENA